MATRALRPPPFPEVSFAKGFARRLEKIAAHLALARERREDTGVPSLLGGGAEFVGYRPYAPGDDLRALDWDVLARTRKPWVRIARRDAGERWLVALDASASMGVGPPGKLQRAAEVTAGIAALALRSRTEIKIRVVRGERGAREFTVARRAALPGLLAFLSDLRAEGTSGLDALVRGPATRAARVFLVGDLQDVGVETALALRTPGRELCVVQILAPIELSPPTGTALEWWDPERGGRLVVSVDGGVREAYARALAEDLESWRVSCARRRVPYRCFSSALDFEAILERSGAA